MARGGFCSPCIAQALSTGPSLEQQLSSRHGGLGGVLLVGEATVLASLLLPFEGPGQRPFWTLGRATSGSAE